MNNEINPVTCPYPQFVTMLAKPMGSLVLDLLHMAIGMAGEDGETFEALEVLQAGREPDPNETLEIELGDYGFYMTGAANLLEMQVNRDTIKLAGNLHPVIHALYASPFYRQGMPVENLLHILTCQFLDLVKKLWVYNREVDGEALAGLRAKLFQCASVYHELRESAMFSEEGLQATNRAKVLKRFEGGKYSDAAALNRKDKTPAPERKFIGQNAS